MSPQICPIGTEALHAVWIAHTQRVIDAMPKVADPLAHVLALPQLERAGLWLEFGVATGRTLKMMAQARGQARVFGFDSFKGLPEPWREGHPAGEFALDEVPLSPLGATHVVGLFAETLPAFWRLAPPPPNGLISLLHIDCDLYSSTKTVLQHCAPRLAPGAFIVFDELWSYPGFEAHEAKALYEAVLEGLDFEWVAVAEGHMEQVAIRVSGPFGRPP